jgi:hypothetical protein
MVLKTHLDHWYNEFGPTVMYSMSEKLLYTWLLYVFVCIYLFILLCLHFMTCHDCKLLGNPELRLTCDKAATSQHQG